MISHLAQATDHVFQNKLIEGEEFLDPGHSSLECVIDLPHAPRRKRRGLTRSHGRRSSEGQPATAGFDEELSDQLLLRRLQVSPERRPPASEETSINIPGKLTRGTVRVED